MTNSDDEGDSCVLLGTPLVDLMPGKFIHPKNITEPFTNNYFTVKRMPSFQLKQKDKRNK